MREKQRYLHKIDRKNAAIGLNLCLFFKSGAKVNKKNEILGIVKQILPQ